MSIWVHPYTVTPVQVMVDIWKIGVGLRLIDVLISWLRLQTLVDYNPQCGMQSTGVWSLSHDTTTSLGLSPTPIILKSTSDLHRHNGVRVHPYAHPQHIKVLKYFVYI